MEGSPLSITASITGILTFIVAIIASIYVRYKVLVNGYDEIWAILNSINQDMKTLEHTGAFAEGDNRPLVAGIKKKLIDLHQLEVKIITKCRNAAYGFEIPATETATNLEHIDHETQVAQAQTGLFRRFRHRLFSLKSMLDVQMFLWETSSFVVRAGVTPTLFRWYGVRNEVMDMVQQRSLLRSQIQHHHMILLHVEIRDLKSTLLSKTPEA